MGSVEPLQLQQQSQPQHRLLSREQEPLAPVAAYPREPAAPIAVVARLPEGGDATIEGAPALKGQAEDQPVAAAAAAVEKARLARVSEATSHHARRKLASQLSRRGQAAVVGEEDRLTVWLSHVRVKPKAPITVTIVGPASDLGPEHVGLFRASMADCRRYFAMRTSRVVGSPDGARTASFHAPKCHGLYDIRVFATEDEDCTPIGRSAPLSVEVQVRWCR